MTSASALWWLALPLLLLPLWWHRRKRQRLQAEPLATARFLPAAMPQQLRVWRWTDPLLLVLRLLLLAAVIAWLADVAPRWRGDTVFISAQANPVWAEAEIRAAGLGRADRTVFCSPAADPRPPTQPGACELHTDDLLAWLATHERVWRTDARLAVVAAGEALRMAAHPPALGHPVDLRLQPAASAPIAATAAATQHHVVLASPRPEAWRALFRAFEGAGLGLDRYVFSSEPNEQTDLIVWDRAGAPDPAWRAPLWWAVQPAAFPELALAQARRSGGVRVADGVRGRVWAQDRWPLDERDPLPGARALFEDRGGLLQAPLPQAPPAMTLAASAKPAAPPPDGASHAVLAPLLALLFALERLLAHRLAARDRSPAARPGASTGTSKAGAAP